MEKLPTEHEQIEPDITLMFNAWFSDSMKYILYQSMRKMLIGLGEQGDRIIDNLDSNMHKEVNRFIANLRKAVNTE